MSKKSETLKSVKNASRNFAQILPAYLGIYSYQCLLVHIVHIAINDTVYLFVINMFDN